jgi:hypothetical protein
MKFSGFPVLGIDKYKNDHIIVITYRLSILPSFACKRTHEAKEKHQNIIFIFDAR